MTRAILVALGTGTILTSVAAMGFGAARGETTPEPLVLPHTRADFARFEQQARSEQRALIEARYQLAKARCAPLRGYGHDQCVIEAHAARGRALLESQDPYAVRPG
jgi:hypothetical protein